MWIVAAVQAFAAETANDTRTQIFDPAFRTLKVERAGDFMSPPVITPGGGQVIISFDELTSDRSYLCYSLYHCNADWQPSQLLEHEYLRGFNKADIEDVGYSRTTFVQYVNYRLAIPSSADTEPLVSGNYLVRIYRDDEPDDILLQARFSVSEESVRVEASADTHTDRGNDGTLQQLVLRLDTGNSDDGLDPNTEIIVAVEQNGDPSTRRLITRPLRVSQGMAEYYHNPDLIFPSGNEWRRFETVRADYPGLHADSARYDGSAYAAFLTLDEGRADKPHTYDETQFGRFMVREYNSADSDTGADYINTHFTLDFPRVMNARIYLDGEFTNHLLLPEYEMHYDAESHLYRATVQLKQGSYNYRYVAVSTDADGNPAGKPQPSLTEGDKGETINEYRIQVYVRRHGSRGDRLVADTVITSTL